MDSSCTAMFALSLLCIIGAVVAINHWILKDDGKISQKTDSPFFMREPHNLVAFLDQIRYSEYVETSYLELLRQREEIVEHLRFSVQYGEDLVDQAKCAMDYYLVEKRMSYLKVTPTYLKRFQLPDHIEFIGGETAGEPICQNFAELPTGPCSYDHLESFQSWGLTVAIIEREEDMNIAGGNGVWGSATDVVRRYALDGLTRDPHSWKFHTMSSYYWRLRGHAQQAIACARFGALFAPREYKDIPLLSLGTILFRAGRLADADVLLSAAVEHAPDVAENHIALASALAMKHDFNRSLHHFDEAERLDASLLPRTQPVRTFIACLENLTKKTSKMYSYVEYMKNEVKDFKKLKYQISQHHEKIIQHQVPLSARPLHSRASSEDLLKRGQYCSTRIHSANDETVLFCDFYSDMHMRLESKDVDIESLERELRLTSEAVIRQVSNEFRKQLNFEQMKSLKAQMPTPGKDKPT